jgi:hypothetical protein
VQYCEGFYSECVRGGREWVCFVTVSSIAACMQIVEEVGSKFHLWPWCVTVYCNVCHKRVPRPFCSRYHGFGQKSQQAC